MTVVRTFHSLWLIQSVCLPFHQQSCRETISVLLLMRSHGVDYISITLLPCEGINAAVMRKKKFGFNRQINKHADKYRAEREWSHQIQTWGKLHSKTAYKYESLISTPNERFRLWGSVCAWMCMRVWDCGNTTLRSLTKNPQNLKITGFLDSPVSFPGTNYQLRVKWEWWNKQTMLCKDVPLQLPLRPCRTKF